MHRVKRERSRVFRDEASQGMNREMGEERKREIPIEVAGTQPRCDLSTRYYNTRGIAASCGNTRYYVLLSDRTIDRHRGDVSIATHNSIGWVR